MVLYIKTNGCLHSRYPFMYYLYLSVCHCALALRRSYYVFPGASESLGPPICDDQSYGIRCTETLASTPPSLHWRDPRTTGREGGGWWAARAGPRSRAGKPVTNYPSLRTCLSKSVEGWERPRFRPHQNDQREAREADFSIFTRRHPVLTGSRRVQARPRYLLLFVTFCYFLLLFFFFFFFF